MVNVYEELNRVFEGQATVLYSDFHEIRINRRRVGKRLESINDGDYFSNAENRQLDSEKKKMTRNDPQLWVVGHSYDYLRKIVNLDTVDCTFRDARYTRDSDKPKHRNGAPTLSANVIPIDNNSNLWLDVRAKGVSTYPAELHTIGGAYDPRSDENIGDNRDREMSEELLGGKSKPTPTTVRCMGDPNPLAILLENRTGWIQAAYGVNIDLSTDKIKTMADDAEGVKFTLKGDNPEFLSKYLQLNANGFVPTGLAGIVLWGNNTYGSGWACETLMGIEKTFREGAERKADRVRSKLKA